MKTLLFKKQVSSDFNQVKRLVASIDSMLDHVAVEVDGKPVHNHGCHAIVNLNYEGSYDLMILSSGINMDKPAKVHVVVKESEQGFHLPYCKLQVTVSSSKNKSNVLKVL